MRQILCNIQTSHMQLVSMLTRARCLPSVLVNKHRPIWDVTPHQNGGHNEKADLSSCTSSTVNLCLRGLVRSSHATDGFAITKPIGNPADRLHQCWCALPLG